MALYPVMRSVVVEFQRLIALTDLCWNMIEERLVMQRWEPCAALLISLRLADERTLKTDLILSLDIARGLMI